MHHTQLHRAINLVGKLIDREAARKWSDARIRGELLLLRLKLEKCQKYLDESEKKLREYGESRYPGKRAKEDAEGAREYVLMLKRDIDYLTGLRGNDLRGRGKSLLGLEEPQHLQRQSITP